MGYYSDVAYAIVFADAEHKDQFLLELSDDDLEGIQDDGLMITDKGLYFETTGTKWYDEYLSVKRHRRVIEASKQAYDKGVPLVGVFVRTGEDPQDIDYENWGVSDGANKLPYWWNLAETRTTIEFGDSWPK